MPIIDVPEADEPIEVPADSVEVQDDEDVVLKTQDELDNIIQSRFNRERNKTRKELKQDEEFFREAASERGIDLREDGKPKGSIKDEELRELKEKASRVDTLEEKVSEYEQSIQQAREERLERQLLDSAPPTANETAEKTFVREAKSQMTYDEEYGWVATDEDGEIIYDAGEPVGPNDVISDLEESHNFLFESTEVQGGADVSPGNTSGGKMTESQYEEEVVKARQNDDMERMEELRTMLANDEIIQE